MADARPFSELRDAVMSDPERAERVNAEKERLERTLWTFQHDACPDCVFLGPFGDEMYLVCDLWFCPDADGLFARVGDVGREGAVVTPTGKNATLPWAVEGQRRARARGLV